MTTKNNQDSKKCNSKRSAMFAYGFIQLGSSVVSALALAAIALNIFSLGKEAKVFNECVEEVIASGKNTSSAVRFCNGG